MLLMCKFVANRIGGIQNTHLCVCGISKRSMIFIGKITSDFTGTSFNFTGWVFPIKPEMNKN